MKIVALIPARAGSKRCPWKNMRRLGGVPLVGHAVISALESGVFAGVYVCTNDHDVAEWIESRTPQAMVIMRSEASCTDDAPDILWVKECLPESEAFAILRPTNPFRTPETIRRAYNRFQQLEVHSMRAVQPVKEHPSKMWVLGMGTMKPAIVGSDWHGDDGLIVPAHSRPTQSLWPYYVQNASLEMAWTFVVKSFGTISGNKIAPFFTQGLEGFDINTEDDFAEAERLYAHHQQNQIPSPTSASL